MKKHLSIKKQDFGLSTLRLFTIFFIAISIVGCKKSEKKAEAIAKPEVKLFQLVGGSILVKKLEVFSQDTTYTGQQKQFTDAYYVISHPKGNLMWDAGLPENLVIPEPYNDPSGVYRIQRPDSLANQLKTIGFKIEDFNYFAMSHSHFDHTGHANLMGSAKWLVQENEFNSVVGDSAQFKNPALEALKNVQKINGDYDVFGDGSVVIKYMPGHTIGHQVLYVEVAGLEKPVLLTGDLYHFEENRTSKGIPSFNYDVEKTLESMNKFEAFAIEKNAEVIIQHSPIAFKKLEELLTKK
ncbi:MAG: N-acyl homoserine lactonase family protein [Polaribacter sp.]|uniref:N-acyl homoserine lactonase family protein n=1 Tax=Polaribacter sp. TaxID=1920175 RepID=UPI002F360752